MDHLHRVACAGVAVALLVTGCGVEVQRAPEPVPADRLPAASPEATAATASVRGRVWGARDGQLVPVFTELDGTGTAARVRALLSLSDPAERPPSALRPGTRLVGTTRAGEVVTLSLSDELRQVREADLPLVLGQLVFTVTEQPDVRRVHVHVGREPVVYVDATGRRVERALVRSDFADLVPAGADD